jgi:diguanylate cyclase (GGDEF)-like protein
VKGVTNGGSCKDGVAASSTASNDVEAPPVVIPTDERVELGRALQRRAGDIADGVIDDWKHRYSVRGVSYEELEALVRYTCVHGAELIGRYLTTGDGATARENQNLAERSTAAVVDQFAMTDVIKNYLCWRDETLTVIHEEAARLGVSRALLREVSAIVSRSADVSMVNMVKEFDVQRRDLQRRLDEERAKLTYQALHDPLTGLANRTLLLDRLAHAMAGTARRSQQVGVLYLDLDGFKGVNDSLGHDAGDRLLVAVAQRLTRLVRPSDTVARLGGDEFVIVCDDLKDGERGLAAFASRLQRGVATTFADEDEITVTVSIGTTIALLGEDPAQVLARADSGMYVEKQSAVRPDRAETERERAARASGVAEGLRLAAEQDAVRRSMSDEDGAADAKAADEEPS